MYKFGIEIFVYLLVQVVYIDINEVCSSIKMSVLDLLCYLHTAYHPFRVFHHIDKQVIFLRRQFYLHPVSCYFACIKID